MARPIIDATAGARDWWEPLELKQVLDTLLALDDDALERVREAVGVQEREFWVRHYKAARIRNQMERDMTFDEAVSLIERVTADAE